jgi:KDO2-lipid IV(A) lauroyltransferase
MLTRLGLGLIWLIHLLPYRAISLLGDALGTLLYLLPTERREVARTNLALCFPERSRAERERLVRATFRRFSRSLLDRGIAWWASKERLARIVRVEGVDNYLAVADRPVILLVPHFVGLDIGATRLAAERRAVSMYSNQKNAVFNAFLRARRNRFGTVTLVSRQEGMKPVIRALRERVPFYYLPDLDFGPTDAVFAPFFGVPAATVIGLPRLARLTGASVVPIIIRQLDDRSGYLVSVLPAWTGFPTGDDVADCRRMNEFIEQHVLEMPEQYHWLHKRFKTRPPGMAPVYAGSRG